MNDLSITILGNVAPREVLEAAMKSIEVLQAENAALREDKERLDWLESLNGPWPTYYDGWHSRLGSHDLLRDAIDANRKKAKP